MHSRLAAFEALNIEQLADRMTTAEASIAALQHPDTGAASVPDVSALGDCVTAIEKDLGPDAPAAPVTPADPIVDPVDGSLIPATV